MAEIKITKKETPKLNITAPEQVNISIGTGGGVRDHSRLDNLEFEKSGHVGFQEKLTFDDTPMEGSENPVKSGGIKTALDEKIEESDLEPYVKKIDGMLYAQQIIHDYMDDGSILGDLAELEFNNLVTGTSVSTSSLVTDTLLSNVMFRLRDEIAGKVSTPELEQYVKKTDVAVQNSGVPGLVNLGANSNGIYISNNELKVYGVSKQNIDAKVSNTMPVCPRQIDNAAKASTHQEMSDEYDVSTFFTSAEYKEDKGNLPVSYNAVKGYVDGMVGDIETALDGIIALQESYIGNSGGSGGEIS